MSAFFYIFFGRRGREGAEGRGGERRMCGGDAEIYEEKKNKCDNRHPYNILGDRRCQPNRRGVGRGRHVHPPKKKRGKTTTLPTNYSRADRTIAAPCPRRRDSSSSSSDSTSALLCPVDASSRVRSSTVPRGPTIRGGRSGRRTPPRSGAPTPCASCVFRCVCVLFVPLLRVSYWLLLQYFMHTRVVSKAWRSAGRGPAVGGAGGGAGGKPFFSIVVCGRRMDGEVGRGGGRR